MALYNQNYQHAQGIANAPFTPYSGELSAGLSDAQLQAGGLLANLASSNPGAGSVNAGIAGARGVLGYQPAQVASDDVRAGMLRDTNLDPYMNPYVNSVIGSTLAQNERARQIAQVSNNQQATGANAFGGSRSGVMGALTNEAWDRNNLGAISQMLADAYGNAQNAALGDINRTFSADQFNAGNRLTASQANAANGLSASAQRLSAAGLLGELGRGQFSDALAGANALQQYGTLAQATQQARDQAAYEEFLRQMNDPYQKQQLLNAALGMIPQQQTTNTHNSGSFLGGLLGTLGQGASAMFGGG
jgi:hypothetical protein